MCDAVTTIAVGVGLGAATPAPSFAPSPPRTHTRPGSDLYDMLFEDMNVNPEGEAPLEFDAEDSGVVSIEDINGGSRAEHHRPRCARCSPPSTSGSRVRTTTPCC